VSLADPETSAALSLLSAEAVRERAHRMLAIGLEDRLPNFRIDLDRMDGAVDLVLETTRKAYPFVRRAVSFALAALRHRWG
jgi:hypothetical protein